MRTHFLPSIYLSAFCLLGLALQTERAQGASPEANPASKSRTCLISISPKRLEILKKGGQWIFEMKQGKRSFGQVQLSLTYDSEKNTLEWEEQLEGTFQEKIKLTFSAHTQLTLLAFESSRAPSRNPHPRKSSGQIKEGQLHGVDTDGDAYVIPYTHDFLPSEGLAFLAIAAGPTNTKDITVRPFDDSVQDLLDPITFKPKPKVTCTSGKQTYVCTHFESKNRNYWISADGTLVKANFRSHGKRFDWTLPIPKTKAAADADKKGAKGISKSEMAALMKMAPATGLLIYKLAQSSNGFKAGLRTGDIITYYNDIAVDSLKALQESLAKARAEKKKTVTVQAFRSGQTIDLTIITGKIGIYPIPLVKGQAAKMHSGGGAPKRKAPKEKWGHFAWNQSGTGIPWRYDIEAAREEAKTEHKPILWWANSADTSPGYDIELLQNYHKVGIFSDPVLVDFIKRRFVSYSGAFNRDIQVKYKLPRLTAPALVFFHPDGSCLHWVDAPTTLNRGFFIKLLTQVADAVKQKKTKEPTPKNNSNAAEQVEILLADFKADAALKTSEALIGGLAQPEQAYQIYLQAKAYRLQRDIKHAQQKLTEASEKTTSATLKEDIQTEFALLHLRMQEPHTCLKILQQSHSKNSKDPGSPRFVEGQYLKGVALRLTRRDQEAREAWKIGAEMRKDDPWGLLCAAEYSGIGPFSRGFYCFHWLPDNALHDADGIRKNTLFPATPTEHAKVIKDAVRYILDLQAADGGWNDTNYDFGNQMGNNPKGVDSMPNVRVAVTAICARALLEWREADGVSSERIDTALEKAWAYLTNKNNVSWNDLNEQIYAHFYRINFFAAWHPTANPKHKKLLEIEIHKIIDRLFKKHQNKKGLWRHEYVNGFVSTAVLLSLHKAMSIGATVDRKRIAKAIDTLKSIRTERGTWPYYPKKGSGPLPWKGSIGRNVSAEAAFVAWDKGSDLALERAIKKYLYWNFVQERVRKHAFHSDSYGTGGFFFWFNAHAFGQALGLVNEKISKEAAASFQAHVLSLRELDGSFVDSFELGKTYATGMALLVLDSCRDALEKKDAPKPDTTTK